jgi:hypothetical protein
MKARAVSRAAAAVAVWMLVSTSASAQTDEQKFYRQQFSDWGGIVFRCLPDKAEDATQKQLCASAGAEARLLAATAKIPFEDAGDSDYFAVSMSISRLNHALVLETRIVATKVSLARSTWNLLLPVFIPTPSSRTPWQGLPKASRGAAIWSCGTRA